MDLTDIMYLNRDITVTANARSPSITQPVNNPPTDPAKLLETHPRAPDFVALVASNPIIPRGGLVLTLRLYTSLPAKRKYSGTTTTQRHLPASRTVSSLLVKVLHFMERLREMQHRALEAYMQSKPCTLML